MKLSKEEINCLTGRGLTDAVAELMDWEWLPGCKAHPDGAWRIPEGEIRPVGSFRPHDTLNHAWRIAEETGLFQCMKDSGPCIGCTLCKRCDQWVIDLTFGWTVAWGPTVPIAICRAVLILGFTETKPKQEEPCPTS